jgi:N-acyl-phosphatidylethanolamine-hydrolysing phospholipase D
LKFQWIGGPTFLLELGSFRILSDPVFGVGEEAFFLERHPSTGKTNVPIRRIAALPSFDPAVDLVLLGLNREDHFDTTAAQQLEKTLPFVSPSDHERVLADQGFDNVEHLNWWEECRREKGEERLSILAVPTWHKDEEELDTMSGQGNGYIIEHSNGQSSYSVYWTGETLWFNDAREIKRNVETVDLLVPNLGAVGRNGPGGMWTLNGKEAMQFVFMFQPKRVIPVSHSTFSHYLEPVDEFKKHMDLTMYERRLVILKEGETYEKNG